MDKKLPSFDTLQKMASENPNQLDQLCHELSESIIDSAPKKSQQRLRGLQFKIDAKKKTAKSPKAACEEINAMMHDSMELLCEQLDILLSEDIKLEKKSKSEKNRNNVLPFSTL